MPRNWEEYYSHSPPERRAAMVALAFAGLLPSGQLLDLAGGDGRNALYFLARDRRVTLIDSSQRALRRAQEKAVMRGYDLRTVLLDLEDASPNIPPGPYAGIIVSYFVHRPLLARLPRLLKPGGLVLLEGFNRSQAVMRQRPRSPYYWEPCELLKPPAGLSLLAAGEGWQESAYRSWAVWRLG